MRYQWRLMRPAGIAVAVALAIALLLTACQQQAPRPSRSNSPGPAASPPSAPGAAPTPSPGSAAAGQPATAARIYDIVRGMSAYGFNPHAPPKKGSQPGGLYINWRGTWDGDPKTAAANTNIQTSGLADQQAGSEARHDPLTDLVYLRNLYAYQAIYSGNREYASDIAQMEPIVREEFAGSSYYRCWVYFQFRDLAELSPGHGWDAIAAHFAAGVYRHFYDKQAGTVADPSHPGTYRTDFAAECGAMLIDAGHRQHNAAQTAAGTATLAHLLQRAQNRTTYLFPLQMRLGPAQDTVVQAQVKTGEEAQLLDAFLDAYDLTGNKSYLDAVVQAANSLYSPALGLWDRSRGGFFFAVDADGHLPETAYKESRQAWMLPLLQQLARIEGGGVWARREQAMLAVVRDKLWQPSIHGYPYRETPGFAVYQSTTGPGHTRVTENWVSSEAMGIAGEALADQLLPLARLRGENNATMERAKWPPR